MIDTNDIRNFLDFVEYINYFDDNLTEDEKDEFISDISALILRYKLKIDDRNDTSMEDTV